MLRSLPKDALLLVNYDQQWTSIRERTETCVFSSTLSRFFARRAIPDDTGTIWKG